MYLFLHLQMTWGYHLILNARNCMPRTIRSKENIYWFTKNLVRDINMVAYGEPQIVMFGTGNKKGYTLVQLIETSNICAHFVEESNDMYLDVFSCKTFDPYVVKKIVDAHFQPSHMKDLLVSRDASEPMKML
jgi:S-adenosylmethionine/arginine decarboxylase-like enzyme